MDTNRTLMLMLAAASASDFGCGSTQAGNGGSAMTADQWCAQSPAQICAARKPCCESAALGFDQAQCEATANLDCSTKAAMVQAGKRGFDPGKASECIQATQAASAKCKLANADYALSLALKQSCDRIFPGAISAGSPCDSSANCSAELGSVGICDSSHTCSVRALVKDGDPCIGDTAGCDPGLYCDTSSPSVKMCRTLVAVAQPCPLGIECDPTGYCDNASNTCVPPLAVGKPCTSNVQCNSFWCAISGECGSVEAYLKKAECGVQ